jgi:hypothetical protein
MYKALYVAVLLVPMFAVAQNTKGATTPPFASPLIVAKGKLVNQTAQIPLTTIFTPKQSGLFRLSAYLSVTQADPNSQAFWYFTPLWTDEGSTNGVTAFLVTVDSLLGTAGTGGSSITFEAKAGTPIQYSVLQNGGPDNSAYLVYYTLERLE